MSNSIDGVPLEVYAKVAEDFNETFADKVKKSKFNEKFLIGLEVVKDKGVHSAKAVYIGKDENLHNETFTFNTPKELVDHIVKENYYGEENMAKSYTDRDLGIISVMCSNASSFRNNIAIIGRLAFNNEETTKLCEEAKINDRNVNQVDSMKMFGACEAGIRYIDFYDENKEEDMKKELNPTVEIAYNERNWREDFCVRTGQEWHEFSYSFERKNNKDKLYYTSPALEEDEKTENLDFINFKDNIDKKNTSVMFDDNRSEIIFAKNLKAMAIYMDTHTKTYQLGHYEVVSNICKAGAKALNLDDKEKTNLRANTKEISMENTLNH